MTKFSCFQCGAYINNGDKFCRNCGVAAPYSTEKNAGAKLLIRDVSIVVGLALAISMALVFLK